MLEEKLEESVEVPSGIVKVNVPFEGLYTSSGFDSKGLQARIVIPMSLVNILKRRQRVKENQLILYYRTIHPRERPNYLELTDNISKIGEDDFRLYYHPEHPISGLKDKNRILFPFNDLMDTGIELRQSVVFVGRENKILIYKM